MPVGRWMVCATGLCAAAAAEPAVVDAVRTGEIDASTARVADAVLYFDFADDVRVAGVVQDASGHGRDGVSEGCTWSGDGRFAGGAMAFAGNDSRVTAYDVPAFTAWERYSACVWFLDDGKGDLGPQYGHKMLDRTSLGHDWHLGLRPEGSSGGEGQVGLHLHEDGRSLALVDDGNSWSDGVWHLAVVVRDGSRGELWIDGVLRAATEDMFGVRGDAPFCVGNSCSPDRHQRKGWSGLLDEVRLFDRALAAEEIADLYQRGEAGGGPNQVSFRAGVEVQGSLSVSGAAVFGGGIRLGRARGDLARGGVDERLVEHDR